MTFASLTYDEQVALLTAAARSILPRYSLHAATLTLLSYANNAVFKVTGTANESFVLRVHRPGHKRRVWIQSEVMWLRRLNQQTTLNVPRPVATEAGDWLTDVAVDTLDAPLPCVLFRWIEGQFFTSAQLRLEDVQRASAFLATLHNYAVEVPPPPEFNRPRLDWEGLFGEQSPYNPGEGARIFTPDQKDVFAQVEDRVRDVFHQLDRMPMSFGVIHADFLPKNFLFTPSGVAAIDFDDLSWGYYLYDLAPSLLLYKGEPRYAELRDAWLAGYASVRALPPDAAAYLEAFMAARHLASCRWQAGHLHNPRIRERAAQVIASRTGDLRRFLETGTL